MDISNIATLVSNVGFPIACCIYMLWKAGKDSERTYELYKELNSKYDQLVEELRKLCAIIGNQDK